MKIATKVSLFTLLIMFLGFFCLWAQVNNTSSKTVGGLIEGLSDFYNPVVFFPIMVSLLRM